MPEVTIDVNLPDLSEAEVCDRLAEPRAAQKGKSLMATPRAWQEGDSIKECGGCTACCRTLSVYELQKPAGEWCRHCASDKKSCGIYANRPLSCREFNCLWLTSPGMSEDMRPDRCGVIWEMCEDGRVALALTRYPKRLESVHQRRLIDYFMRHGVSVIVMDPGATTGANAMLYLAPGATEKAVMASLFATARAQQERVRKTLTKGDERMDSDV
jgi:hypothetical protein